MEVIMKNNWIKKIENIFAAAAFAEAGEHETALKFADIKPSNKPGKVSKFLKGMDTYFSAVAFAEADCHDVAREYLGKSKSPARSSQPLDDFLETIGLQGVRVSYGVVTI